MTATAIRPHADPLPAVRVSASVAVAAAGAAWLALHLVRHVAPIAVLVLGIAAIGAGALVTLTRLRLVGLGAAASGAAMAAVTVPHAALSAPERGVWWSLITVLACLAIGSAVRRFGAALLAALTFTGLAVVWAVVLAAGWGAALPGVVSVLLLGPLARRAAVIAGLTGFGRPVAAALSVRDAHREMLPSVVVVSVSAAVAGVFLSRTGPLSVLLAVLFAVILLSRSRTQALVTETVLVFAGGAVVVIALVARWIADDPPSWPLGAALAFAVVAVAVSGLALPPTQRERAVVRRVADVAELVAVVGCVPVAIGALVAEAGGWPV